MIALLDEVVVAIAQ